MNNITQIKDKIQKINELIKELENDLTSLETTNSFNKRKAFSKEAKAVDVYRRGKFVETIPSINQAAKKYNITYGTVWNILNNVCCETRKHLSFKYANNLNTNY